MIKELETIASKLNEERSELFRAVGSLTEDQAAQTIVVADWSVKDVLAHLAGAERGMLRMAQYMAQGQNPQLPPGYSNDEYNARQVAKRKEKSLAETRAEMEGSRAELIALLETLTPQQLGLRGEHPILGQTTVKDVVAIIGKHEALHCKEISGKLRESKE